MFLFHFQEITGHICLNQQEWLNMIDIFINKMKTKYTTLVLINKLYEFINKGYKVTISNNDLEYSSIIYPKVRFIDKFSVLVVIPSVPYFTTVDTISVKYKILLFSSLVCIKLCFVKNMCYIPGKIFLEGVPDG